MYDMVGKAVRDVVIYILIGLTETRDTDTDTDDLPKAKVISEKKKVKLILFDEYAIRII